MATANEIDEIRATLQRGLENLALSGNLKPLPLRQQAERPVLRNPITLNGYRTDLTAGKVGTLQGPPPRYNQGYRLGNTRPPRRPVSAKKKSSPKARSPRDSHSTFHYSKGSPHTKPPTGRPRPPRPVSSKSRNGVATSRTTPAPSCPVPGRPGIQRAKSQIVGSSAKTVASAADPIVMVTMNNNNEVKPTAIDVKKNSFVVYESENDSEGWQDIEEGSEASACPEFDPLENERLPADGASVDDFDEDDGLDGLDDEEYGDEETDGYSIASGQSYKPPIPPCLQPLEEPEPPNGYRRSVLASRSASSQLLLLTTGDEEAEPALSPSLFSNVPPTINFVADGEKVVPLPWDIRKLLKWRMSTVTPNVVKNCIARSGFRATKKPNEWLGYWGKHMKGSGFRVIKDYQKINHFPGSFQMGRKDRLWKNLHKMQLHHGKKEYNFFPRTFVLPFDLKLLKRAWEDGSSKQKWILKPPASARGIGVRVIHKWSQIPKRKSVIVQKYISKPYLINGSKFDLRLYVWVASFDPLRVYVYDDGLTRFATMKYSSSMKSLSNKYMHLTNYSINKKSSDFTSNSDIFACEGHKWSLVALWGYLKQKGVDTAAVIESIHDLIIKTILCADSSVNSMIKANVRSRYSVHELFGFDVMLDENLKPWIIEVNVSPSLHSNSPLDTSIKGGMVKDLHNMAGFQVPDRKDVYPSLQHSVTPVNKDCYREILQDKRMFTNHLSQDERAKHAFYTQKHLDEQCRGTVLETLTPDDLRCLIHAEDEYSRRGHFVRIFPTPNTIRYHRFFEAPRYNNILLDEWTRKYAKQPSRGLALLEDYCAEKVHLGPCKDRSHVWTPVSSVLVARTCSAPSSSLGSPTHASMKKSSSANSLPKLRRKAIKGSSLSSSGGSVPSVAPKLKHPHPPPMGTSISRYSSGYSTPS